MTFDVPTNGYTDLTDPYSSSAGSVPSDFQQPFTGGLSSFGGLSYFDAGGPDMLDLLAGSGGGTWLDISGTGLSRVGYIRFSLSNDGNSGTNFNFELDAVSIAHDARRLGGAGTMQHRVGNYCVDPSGSDESWAGLAGGTGRIGARPTILTR